MRLDRDDVVGAFNSVLELGQDFQVVRLPKEISECVLVAILSDLDREGCVQQCHICERRESHEQHD